MLFIILVLYGNLKLMPDTNNMEKSANQLFKNSESIIIYGIIKQYVTAISQVRRRSSDK